MEPSNYGGPAFPVPNIIVPPAGSWTTLPEPQPGMTLKDWFAGMALVAYLGSNEGQRQLAEAIETGMTAAPDEDRRKLMREILAKRSYLQADAMLAERQRTAAKAGGK